MSAEETAGSGPAVALRGISKRFGWNWALRDLSLVVERGTTVGLVGPNGAGKTTLLRLIATLIRPTTGDGEVFGRQLRREADMIRRRLGLLTGQGYLYGDLTAAENLRFTARMTGRPADRDRDRELLERVGLASVADRRLRAFSTGMHKRLALAQLLLRNLDLVLLDEPYSGLDTEGVGLVDEIVQELHRGGSTVIIASHREGEAMRTAERTVVLRDGMATVEDVVRRNDP